MMEPLISIIVPVYNVEKYIIKCIKSIIGNSYKNIEVIVVNDGSTDSSINLLKTIDDVRIKIFNKENGGLSDARNFGLEQAKGEFIMFVDSDDYIHQDMVRKLYHEIMAYEADLAICDFIYVNENGEVLSNVENQFTLEESVMEPKELFDRYLLPNFGKFIPAWNKLYKSSLFKGERFDCNKLHEDEFILHRIISKCKKIVCSSDKLYYYVQRQNSIMNKKKSIRNLDAVEALYYRFIYFKENDYYELLPKVEENMTWIFRTVIPNLNGNDMKSDRFLYIVSLYKKIIQFLFLHGKISFKRRIRFLIFMLFKNYYFKFLYIIVDE